MSKLLKAALLSAFLFPGSGHFLLKKYIWGGLLAGVAILCVYVLLSTTIEIAQEISANILNGKISFDATNIAREITNQIAVYDNRIVNYSTYLLVICWLVGIVDSYRLGLAKAKGDNSDE